MINAVGGGPEWVLSRIQQEMSEQLDRVDQQRQNMKETSERLQQARLSEMRDAIDDQLLAGIFESAGQGAAGAGGLLKECGTAWGPAAGQSLGALGQLANAWETKAAQESQRIAEGLEFQSGIASDEARALDKESERVERRLDKSMETMEQLARERMDARLSIVRG